LENMTDHGARGAFSGWCDIWVKMDQREKLMLMPMSKK